MEHQNYITDENGCLFFRPQGEATVRDLLQWMEQLATHCLENGHYRVLVNATSLTHETLTALDRYQLGTGVVSIWPPVIRLSMVGRSDQLDPRRFVQMVAANRGLCVGVFEDEIEALIWLGTAKNTIPNEETSDNTSNDVAMVLTNSA